jgi:hypothetical protein
MCAVVFATFKDRVRYARCNTLALPMLRRAAIDKVEVEVIHRFVRCSR